MSSLLRKLEKLESAVARERDEAADRLRDVRLAIHTVRDGRFPKDPLRGPSEHLSAVLTMEANRMLSDARRPSDENILWQGEIDGALVRVRRGVRLGLVVEGRRASGPHGVDDDGAWDATDDRTALRAYELALLARARA